MACEIDETRRDAASNVNPASGSSPFASFPLIATAIA